MLIIGFLLGLALGLLAMCIVGTYYTVKIDYLKLKYKIYDE